VTTRGGGRRLVCLLALAVSLGATAQDRRDEGLSRLAAMLDKQLSLRKGALPLPWSESILDPRASRLVWYPRSLTTRASKGDAYRVAFDPVTHWYFVARVPKGGGRLQYFGPLEAGDKGSFVEAFGRAGQ
jgi:hypothetical protein